MGIFNVIIVQANLVNMTGIAPICAMHAACASSFDARPAGKSTLQLGEGTRDLVAHGSMTLVVVDWSSSRAAGVLATSGPSGLGCCGCGSGCTSDGVALGGCSPVAAA